MYSREEILGMVAGPELDALVAEHVMGYTIVPPNTTLWKENAPYPFIIHDEEWGYRLYEEPAEDGWPFSQFNPSTDIAAAWEVVEKMRETHVYELADFGRNTHKKQPHYAAFHPIDKPRDYERQVRSMSLPEAISKAALLSLLKED